MTRPFRLPLARRCRIYAERVDEEGWHVAGNVLWKAADFIEDLESNPMEPADLQSARQRLGLTQKGLAEALRMGKQGGRTVRRWELGEVPIPGPVQVAVELMLDHLPRRRNVGG